MNRVRHPNMGASNVDQERHRIARRSREGQLSRVRSRSTPSIPASAARSLSSSTRSLSTFTDSAKQDKFHRYFRQVSTDEYVLHCYNCAMVREILLQGHLFITPNYFAFYSNILGYVTKLLIPMTSVIDISKEKMAKILPNEIAITTEESKYVFCSLYWKNSTFKLLKQVWRDSKGLSPEVEIPAPVDGQLCTSTNHLSDISEKNSEEQKLGNFQNDMDRTPTPPVTCPVPADRTDTYESAAPISRPVATTSRIRRFFKSGTIFAILAVLLAVLYVSAALMMVRIDRLHAAYLDHQLTSPKHTARNYLSQYLQLKLDQIVQVRHNLQTLSQHFVTMADDPNIGPISDSVFDLDDASH